MRLCLFREMVSPTGEISRSVSLNSVSVLGGGILSLQSDKNGINLNVTNFKINTGGKVDAVRLNLESKTVEIAQSALLDLNYKVCTALSFFCNSKFKFGS